MREIELLSGATAARERHCLREARGGRGFLWLQRGRPRRPWEGVRQLVAQARDVLGEPSLEDILQRHRAAAELLLAPTSPPASRPSRLAARLESHLTHNALVKRPFIDQGLEILAGLLGSRDVVLVAPSLTEVDSETLWLLDKLVQRRPEAFPSAVLGFEPEPFRTEPDERGIVWGPFEIDLASFVFNLSRLPGARRLAAVAGETPGEGLAAVAQRIGPDGDSAVLEAFEATPDPPGPELRHAMVELVRRAFAAHAFEAALLWGLRLLGRCPDLAPLDAAEMYNVVGLCAHNRQFHATGNERLAPFLETVFRRGLETETRPAWRSALAYRLAVTLGRRGNRLEEAMEAAREAIETATTEPLPERVSAYLEAWGRNIRAFLGMRLGRLDQAVEDTERALDLVHDARDEMASASADFRATWQRDFLLSWSVLASNRIALGQLAGDAAAVELWQRRNQELAARFPELELYKAADWLMFYRQTLRFDLALDRARQGLELAREQRNALWEYQFLAQVADLAFRLGRVDVAIEACEAAHRFRRAFANPGALGSLDLLHAEALGRAGFLNEARRVAQAVLAEPGLSPARRVEAQGLSARLAAEMGDAAAAEAAANQAIDTAVEHGHRDSLLLAAVAAATASHRLGLREDARSAYSQALEIAATGAAGDPPPPAGDVLEAHLGLWRDDPDDPAPLLQALRILPRALEEPRGWWLLAPLAAAVETARSRQPSLFEPPDLAEPVERLRLAGGQRSDGVYETE